MSRVERHLRITGPTPLPEDVLAAVGSQSISHRGQEFRQLMQGMIPRLRAVFGTEAAAVLPFTASGTGGMEASVVNLVAPGQKVLAVICGYFGERFAQIAGAFGAEVVRLDFEYGQAADPGALRQMLREVQGVAAVLVTHNETSSGVLNPLPELARVVREESNALLLVDGVSSVGAVPVNMDALGLDVVITASQKALMAPPGLAILAVSCRALEAARRNPTPRFYLDFERMAQAVAEGTTTYTPALPTFFGLARSLERIEDEKLPTVFERHRRLAERCRQGAVGLGFTLFACAGHRSPTVTALLSPRGVPAGFLRKLLEERGIFVSQGRAPLKERMLRVGHMGFIGQADVDVLLGAFSAVLSERLAPC